jgi:RNA recognition motif-containing protein
MQVHPNIQESTSQDSKPSFSSQGNGPTLFLSSLHCEIALQDLHDHFSQFGVVAALKINKKGLPSKKSTAIMRMETEEAVERLISEPEHLILGHKIFVEKKLSGKDLVLKNEDIGLRRVHISNIPAHVTGEELLKLFSKFGRVEMAYSKNPKDSEESQNLKIYGFVTYFDSEDARKLVEMRTVKFDSLEEELEIKSFNKKSVKLSLDYFNKNQEQTAKIRPESKKGKKKSKKRQRGNNNKPIEAVMSTRENSPEENLEIGMEESSQEELFVTEKRRVPLTKLLFSSVMNNHTEDNVKLNKVGVAPARQSYTFFVQPSANLFHNAGAFTSENLSGGALDLNSLQHTTSLFSPLSLIKFPSNYKYGEFNSLN